MIPTYLKSRQVKFARNIASTTLLFLSYLMVNAQLVGADLNYVTSEQEIEVSVTCFYDCAFDQIPQTEYASVVESMAKGSQQYLTLERTETKETASTNAAPCKGLNACLNKVQYSTKVPLNIVPGGFDITWVHKMNKSFMNTRPVEAISLTAHVGERGVSEGNASPRMMEAPTARGCVGFENSSLVTAIDDRNQDSIRFELTTIKTAHSEYDPAAEHKVGPEGMEAIPLPPFKSAVYNAAHSAEQPFGNENISLDKNTNLLKFKPDTAGLYLLAFTIYDVRDGQEIGTSQRIFITDLK